MFSALRQGSPLFVLDKDSLLLKVGSVISTTQPTFGNQWLPNMQLQPLDVSVKFDDGETMEFKQMQPSMSTASYGKVVVTETKELMAQEVEQMMRNSKSVVDSIPYHEKVLSSCKGMMAVLSPSYAHDMETDKQIAELKDNIGSINNALGEIKNMMQVISSSAKSKN